MRLGRFEIFFPTDGSFSLDGGAMFGVVPRVIWEKTNPPDSLNRVPLSLSSLLIKTGEANILVDTGVGERFDEKFKTNYAIDKKEGGLEAALSALGLGKGDIDIVVNTHLHFDHAGGNTAGWDGPVPAFPHARYIVQKGELEAALNPNERTRASYRQGDFRPVMDAGLFELVEDEGVIADGVSVIKAPGHNENMQVVKVCSEGHTAVFLSDLVPTATHLKYPYIAGYDLFPLETLKMKKKIIEQAAKERWLLVFCHDPFIRCGYVSIKDGTPVLEKVNEG